jgi:phospholipid/cholesterol/gamma-HCH transport system substrate-binding protein
VSERLFRILTGLTTFLFGFGAVVLGIKWSNGDFDAHYHLLASFSSAGQGLIQSSDVKVHGVDIGHVTGVKLINGRAQVRMWIKGGEKVPTGAMATIRPKTLFGEKFVDIDPGSSETSGPFLHEGDHIKRTLGGIELEKVLTDLYPVLKAVQPEQLMTIVDTLAQGGAGQGPAIARQITAFRAIADVQANHAADTQQFLDDLARLSDELANRAGDLVQTARNANSALPPLNARGDELTTVLEQGARLSHDLADVLENNRPFLTKSVTEGSKTIQILFDNRGQIGPLVTGLREFIQALAEVGRIPYGDGTNLAAVKFIIGEDCPAGRFDGCPLPASAASPTAGTSSSSSPGPLGLQPGPTLTLPPLPPAPAPVAGTRGIVDMIRGLVG